ncbi:D-alanine--D-alanine ligase [Deltaproteobacteria bacterium TL4]
MHQKKLTVGILCGGKSGEHEVSLISANNIQAQLNRDQYEVKIIGIDKNGKWFLNHDSEFLKHADDIRQVSLDRSKPEVYLQEKGQLMSVATGACLSQVDVFFPITHGEYGEDGALQGYLTLMDVPYVGPDVWGSAIGMDKDVCKRLLRDSGIPITPFITLVAPAHLSFEDAVAKLGLPLFVKPCRQGSSIGISKVSEEAAFQKALQKAWAYDRKILIEQAFVGREIECAVLGNEQPEASHVLGEIVPRHEFYSYEAKYVDEHGADLIIPALLADALVQELRQAAVKTFQVLECQGLARVDFFVEAKGGFVVNEINTLPGFTSISMYPKLWEASGKPYPRLLDALITLAMERKQQKDGSSKGL